MNNIPTNQIQNNSGLRPLGRAVLVKPYEPEKKRSLIALPDSVTEKMVMTDTRVIIIELGQHCWPDEPPRAKVGDKVFISKFSGAITRGTKDGEVYRVVNDKDIYLQIVEEEATTEGKPFVVPEQTSVYNAGVYRELTQPGLKESENV